MKYFITNDFKKSNTAYLSIRTNKHLLVLPNKFNSKLHFTDMLLIV
ncbi:protein of unknown function [Chryseobacterium sp. JV274]|nr:protein of unknown function [Chryseobacterium sp. JV274]